MRWVPVVARARRQEARQRPKRFIVALRSTHTPKWIVADAIASVRQTLDSYLELPRETEVALTPSGTDAELLAVALADRDPDRPIMNLVVGPDEVGSGTIRAAAGRHYDCRVPRGGTASPGTPVDAMLSRRIEVKAINVREADGAVRHPSELDAEIQQLVSKAVENGYQVLLHAVAHSKTGIYAPRLETLQRIQTQLPHDVVIIVDAAQGRIGGAFGTVSVGQLAERGWMINFTGSKFFAGPPFSGALIVPRLLRVSGRTRGLPPSFGNYFSRAEMPRAWTAIRQSMDSWINVPAIARWTAAVAEIESFRSVALDLRKRVTGGFERSALDHLSSLTGVNVLPSFDHRQSDWAESSDLPMSTVVSFSVRGKMPLGRPELSAIHRDLNDADQPLPIQLGQPVQIAPGRWVLRVALSAPMLTRVATDTALGTSVEDRLAWFDRMMRQAADRIGMAVERAARAEVKQPDVRTTAN